MDAKCKNLKIVLNFSSGSFALKNIKKSISYAFL